LNAGIAPGAPPASAGRPYLEIADYRTRWKLPADHPITAPAYSIDTSTHAGLRDRALIGLMVYSFTGSENERVDPSYQFVAACCGLWSKSDDRG
jgi:hypothetical protein